MAEANTVTEHLFSLRDEKYAKFQSKLTPNVDEDLFIGVRVPVLRKLVKELKDTKQAVLFMEDVPHKYFDENMLHSLLISQIREYENCLEELERFLPYVDNWAVCDILSPKVFWKNKADLICRIKKWIDSPHTYTCRFGMGMLMEHFLDEQFDPAYLQLAADVHSDEYYIQMMAGWFFATALAKQWEDTVIYIEQNRLDKEVWKKTIQKARESYRITDEQKAYLKELREKVKGGVYVKS